MTPEQNIELALFDRVRTLSLSPSLPVSWPNEKFVLSAVSGSYLEVTHFRNQNERLFLKGSDEHRMMGFLQVCIRSPLLAGDVDVTGIAGAIVNHFPADLPLFSEGVKVRVTKKPDVMSAIKTDVSWDVPVSIYYEAFV